MSAGPEISVVIPTCNRVQDLRRVLHALMQQDFDARAFEVVVVADGCTDGTAGFLQLFRPPFELRILTRDNGGPAEARNAGAEAARGRLLVFLDDDVEPSRALLTAHWQAHVTGGEKAVVGPYPPASVEQGLLQIKVSAWMRDLFESMANPGHRYSYQDLLTGNLSIRRSSFMRLGGFDPELRAHEDYEFGLRVLVAGMRIAFAPDAQAWHHETITLARVLNRKRDEGYADVAIARAHPALVRTLPFVSMGRQPSMVGRLLRRVAREHPESGDILAGWIAPVLQLMDRLRLRSRWATSLSRLQEYWYWRGVWEALGSVESLRNLMQSAKERVAADPDVEVDVDLARGIDRAALQLETGRVDGVRLHYSGRPIGRIPPERGMESLRGRHLRAALVGQMAAPLLAALASDGNFGSHIDERHLVQRIWTRSFWFGGPVPDWVWSEQARQWAEFDRDVGGH